MADLSHQDQLIDDFLAGHLEQASRQMIASVSEAGLAIEQNRLALNAAGHDQEFSRWCAEACQLPSAEAALIARWATARPGWLNPAAIDLDDPIATEIKELIFRHWLRHAAAPEGVVAKGAS